MTRLTLEIDENRIDSMNQAELHEFLKKLNQTVPSAPPEEEVKREDPSERNRLRKELETKMDAALGMIAVRMRYYRTLGLEKSGHYDALRSLYGTIRADRYGATGDKKSERAFLSEFSIREFSKYKECLEAVNLALNGQNQQKKDQGWLQMARHYDHLSQNQKIYPHLACDHRKGIMICMGVVVLGMIAMIASPILAATFAVTTAAAQNFFAAALLAGFAIGITGAITSVFLDKRPQIGHSDTSDCGSFTRSLRNSFGLFREVKERHQVFRYGDTAPSAPLETLESPANSDWYPDVSRMNPVGVH